MYVDTARFGGKSFVAVFVPEHGSLLRRRQHDRYGNETDGVDVTSALPEVA